MINDMQLINDMPSRALTWAMAGLLFAGVSASSPAATIAPDDGVAPRWEKPQTTRRYLQGPLSERLLTFWREGKLIFAENMHQPDWQLPYAQQIAHGAWLVRGDGTPFNFKDAHLNVTQGGEPDHSQFWLDGGMRVTVDGQYQEEAEDGTDLRALIDKYVSVGTVNNIGYPLHDPS